MNRKYKILTSVLIGFLSFVFVECNRIRSVEGSTTDNSVCGNNANTVVFFVQQLNDMKTQLQNQVKEIERLQKIETQVNALKISSQTGASITTDVDNMKKALQHLNFSLSGHDLLISNFDSRLNKVEKQPSSNCDENWQHYDGRCYRFNRSRGTYKWAQQWCTSVGGHLARVDGPRENEWLKLQMRVQDIHELWIGATDASQEGKFVWESTNDPLMFTDWSRGQPDNGGSKEHYVHIRKVYGYKWNDAAGDLKFFSVCEK